MATPTQPKPSGTIPALAPVYDPKSESVAAKRTRSVLFHIVALALTAVVLYPAAWMVASSFKPNSEIGGTNTSLWSENFSFDNFVTAMDGIGGVSTLQFFTNSLVLAIGAVVGTVLSASVSAYAFARIKFPGRSVFFGMMIATLLLPFHVVIIPQYIIFQQLGLIDTYIPLLIGKFLAADAFFVFLMVQFMRNLPAELDEAARIDGAGHVRIFGSIMLPLMKPALISTSIFSFIWSWNDFLGPLLYLNTPEKYPLPLALRLFQDQTQSSDYGAMIAMSVLALLPVLVFFLVFQRYIVEGVSTQGLKGCRQEMSIMDSTTPAAGREDPIPVNRFALFSETLLAGLLVLVLSLPLVTIPAAYAAGIAHLERHLSGRDDSLRALWGTFRSALPGSWKLGITTAAAAVVIILNLLLATVGQLPGSPVVLPATLVLAAAGAILLLRTAAAWSSNGGSPAGASTTGAPATAWPAALEAGKALSLRDWTGSLLLAAALFAAVVFVWMLAALFVVVPGTLILASAAVKMRSTRA